MRALENENDPRILKELLKMSLAEIDRLKGVVSQIEAEKAKIQQQSFSFEESLVILKKKFFGPSSEKSERSRSRKSDDPELLLHSQNLVPPASKKATKNLNEEVKYHKSTIEDLKSMSEALGLESPSENQWEKIEGLYDVSTEIEIVERTYKKIIHKRDKHRLKKEFNKTDKEVIISADGPVKLLPGCTYSIDFAVSVVVDKYLNHLPLERQCRIMDSLGLEKMSTQTLYNLSRITSEYLIPITEKIRDEILNSRVIHSDETPWPINNKKDSDGYMWIVANNRGTHCRFEPTRSGKVIRETLKDFKGTVVTDGYGGYSQFREENVKNTNNINLAQCHSHARRYFDEIKDNYSVVNEYMDFYKELFRIEWLAKDFNELANLRRERSALLIDKMHEWLKTNLYESRSESYLQKAIAYSLNHWPELIKFLEDPEIPLTNNEAERSIRQAVLGRKNFYGSRSIDGADVAAIFYTIIESCKKVEIDPRNYLLKTVRACASGDVPLTPTEFAKNHCQ